MRDLDHAIVSALRGIDGIDALLIFGSRAGGEPRPDSDLDVAVLPGEGIAQGRRRLQTLIAVALGDLVPDGRVDVIFIDEAPELLRQRIFESGRALIDRNPARLRTVRLWTMREHGDREPYRRLLMRAQEARLAGRGADRG